MRGRAFLAVAQRLLQHGTEADLRTAAGRSYYALVQEAGTLLRNWGFRIPRDRFHSVVRLAFVYSTDQDLKGIGQDLEDLGKLRNEADYQLEQSGAFAASADASLAIRKAHAAIAFLDMIEADAARRAAAIADIQKHLPP